jgi:hypothetical protein
MPVKVEADISLVEEPSRLIAYRDDYSSEVRNWPTGMLA